MIEIVSVTYPPYGRERKPQTWWRVFQDGEHVQSFREKEDADRFVEQLRDCEIFGG